ncbi:MAG: DUF4167 domain-containing protein [Alphaproteobacteria bacterium]|nr:DUF4167 domain-containing protein [Alphaproteobacteria bacterium]
MRQGGPNGRRPRGRHHGGSNGMNNGGNGGNSSGRMNNGGDNRPRSASSLRHQTFDSNGPDVRVRGNAWQVYEKYQSLARDSLTSGDRVAAENYQQHAEHYYRIIEAINEATATEQHQRGAQTTPAYNQQPDMPQNYYAPDGTLTGNAAPVAQSQDSSGNQQPQMAQAEVQPRNPPPQATPFFSQEEVEEVNAPEPLVARR